MTHINADRDNASSESCDYQRRQDERPLAKAEQEVDYIELLATIVVNFVSWSVMWPAMFVYRVTIAVWKSILYFWVDFISKLISKTLPDF